MSISQGGGLGLVIYGLVGHCHYLALAQCEMRNLCHVDDKSGRISFYVLRGSPRLLSSKLQTAWCRETGQKQGDELEMM